MKIPNKIKIGGIWIDVKIIDDDEMDKDCGEADFKHCTIKLSDRLKQDNLELTFFHEVFHHIDPALDEHQVELYSRSLFQILKDNKII